MSTTASPVLDPQEAVPVQPALAVAPVRVRDAAELDAVVRRLVSIAMTAPGFPIIVASGSDSVGALLDQVAVAADELGGELVRGPATVMAAVNAGLRAAREAGIDAVLVSGDLEIGQAGWLEVMRARRDLLDRPTAVVGARLVHPNGLVSSAGLYFSTLQGDWLPRLQYAPRDLPAVLAPCLCPVTGLLLVRAQTLAHVGLFDEELGYEHAELDFCLRAFAAGQQCVYEPAAVAVHQSDPMQAAPRSPADQREHERSAWALRRKHKSTDFRLWAPEV